MNKYETYKPSGIDWIGEVPSNWQVKRLKNFTLKILGGGTPTTGIEKYWDDEKITGIPWVAIADITKAEIIVDTDKFITTEGLAASSTQLIEKGKILYSIYASLGKVAIAGRELATNQAILSIYENPVLSNVNYLKYCLKGIEDIISGIGSSTTQNNISLEKLRTIKFPLPKPTEQLKIANYLDDQTHRIDQLIANKKTQAEKLKELRQIEINNAVTKGLKPDAEMKDSGIVWLGEIPKHWEVKRMKNIANVKYGLGQPPEEKEDGLPLIRATNVERGKINDKDLIFVDPADVPYERDPILKENDIIVVRSGAYTADSAIIPKKYEGAIAGYDMVMRVVKSSPLFISYSILSNYLLINQLFLERLRAAQPHLNKEELSKALVVVPPLKEQLQIANYLAERTGIIDHLLSNIKDQIEKLQELRKIKIYEAVTGKIKVNSYAEATA